MSFASPVALTADGIQQLRGDLLLLRERRDALAGVLADAPLDAGGGVLTDIALADRRIAEITDALSRARLLDGAERVAGVVGIGSRVTVLWDSDGEETYTIVDPVEASASEGRISDESPVGQALLNRRIGDRLVVSTLGGDASLRIQAVA